MWAGRGGGSWLLGWSAILNKRGKSALRAKQVILRKGAGGVVPGASPVAAFRKQNQGHWEWLGARRPGERAWGQRVQ